MKIGVKAFCEEEFLNHFEDDADFFEIMAIQGMNYSFLSKFKLPIVIHAEHQGFGVDGADKTKITKNKESVNFAIDLANKCKSKKIIIHPGSMTNPDCSEKQAINFLNLVNDKRVLIENLPKTEDLLCTTPQETKKFIMETKAKFCFDINHAIETAVRFRQEYLGFIKEFIKLRPSHYHLGGQKIKGNKIHLSLADSDIPLKKIMEIIPKDAEITLETEHNIQKVKDDIKIMRELIQELT